MQYFLAPRRRLVMVTRGHLHLSSSKHVYMTKARTPTNRSRRTAGELIDAEYTLVRVTLDGHETVDLDEIARHLDETVGHILQVPIITPLNDGSWEILVRNAYLPTLQHELYERPIRLILDLEYYPLEPLRKDVEYLGLEKAQELYALWFLERALRIIRESWAIAQLYYRHVLKRHLGRIRTLLSEMGTMACMEDSILDCLLMESRNEDVRRLVMLIRRRLSKFPTGQSLRHQFRSGDIQA